VLLGGVGGGGVGATGLLRESKRGASFGGGDPGDHGVAGGSIVGAGVGAHDEEDDKDTSGVSTTSAADDVRQHPEEKAPDVPMSPPPPLPPSPPPPLSPPPLSRVEDNNEAVNEKTATATATTTTTTTTSTTAKKLVAGNAALEVDHSTHATNKDAAKAIAQAGRDVKVGLYKLNPVYVPIA
jgi:hypothetical protein